MPFGFMIMRLVLILALSFMSLISATPTSTQMPTATPDSAQSKELNSLNSEKTSVQNRRNDLEARQDLWHGWYLTLAIVAVALGALSWLFQHLESRNARREKPLISRISQIDERVREIEKQIADTALAETGAIAADATSKAGIANEAAGAANERAGKLEKDAAEERIRASNIEHETVLLRQQNLATEGRLTEANAGIESEKAKRLQMELLLAPRVLLIRGNGKGTNLDILKEFTDMKVYVRFLPDDAEVRRATESIAGTLHRAGFTDIELQPFPGAEAEHFDGVNIGTSRPIVAQAGSLEDFEKSKRGERLLLVFSKFFADEGWISGREWAERGELKENEFRITVGFKPNPPPEFKDEELKELELMKRLPLSMLTPPK
jgi:hypothetical protein